MTRQKKEIRKVTIGDGAVFLPGTLAMARQGATVVLGGTAAFRRRRGVSRRLPSRAVGADIPVHAVTTGIGKFCGHRLAAPTCGDRLVDGDTGAPAGRIAATGFSGEG